MDDVDWLVERLGDTRCASCGLRYTKDAVRGIGYENDRWFVYLTCLGCGMQGVGISMSAALNVAPAADAAIPALETDDVLDAHEFLRAYRGDAHGLFAAPQHQHVA